MFSSVFQHLIKDISENGEECKPRDLAVKEQLFTNLPINPVMPFADYQHRAFNWKYFPAPKEILISSPPALKMLSAPAWKKTPFQK